MSDLVRVENKLTVTPEQEQLLRDTVAKGSTPDEFALFLGTCNRTGLDPFTRQIYSIKRDGKMVTQISIDGARLIAERSGKYAGQVCPYWCGKDGVWVEVWLSSELPSAAKVGVMRNDFSEPLWGVARFDAYAVKKAGGGLNSMWTRMADVMIAKCAEMLALRKAFPQDLSGLYTGDEMGQAANHDVPAVSKSVVKRVATQKQAAQAPAVVTATPVEHVVDYDDDSERVLEVVDKEKKVRGDDLYQIVTTARKYTCLDANAVATAKQALETGRAVAPDWEQKAIGDKGRTYNQLDGLTLVDTVTGELADDIAEAMPTIAEEEDVLVI